MALYEKIEYTDCLREAEQLLQLKYPVHKNNRTLRTLYTAYIKEINYPKGEGSAILDVYKYTYDGSLFLLYDSGADKENRIMIFSTIKLLSYLSRCEVVLSDGTFYSTPKEYGQVYIMYGYFFNCTIPLAWCLMENRKKDSYNQLIIQLKTLCNFEPKFWILDFETAIIYAIKDIFPSTELKGCWFHFTQICIRWLQKNQLISKYQTDKNFSEYVKKLLLLAYFPAEQIVAMCDELRDGIKDLDMGRFYNHFRDNFVFNVSNISKEVNFWSCHKSIKQDIPITTNSCEAYHRHLNSRVRKSADFLNALLN